MKNIVNKINLISLLVVFSISIMAQKLLTNNDVVEMVNIGLEEQVIITKIKNSESNFDTSTESLKFLTEKKIPSNIIVAMIESSNTKLQKQSKIEIEEGTLSDIKGLKKVFVLAEDTKSKEIIVEELKKKRFEIVEQLGESEFSVGYTVGEVMSHSAGMVIGNVVATRPVYKTVGVMTVFMSTKDANKLRKVFTVKKEKYYSWNDIPAKSSIKEFLKEFEKVNR